MPTIDDCASRLRPAVRHDPNDRIEMSTQTRIIRDNRIITNTGIIRMWYVEEAMSFEYWHLQNGIDTNIIRL